MTLKRKIFIVTAAFIVLAVASFSVAISHNSACAAAPALPPDVPRMRAIMHRCYGPPDTLALETIAKPVPDDEQVLVRVHAASVNPADWHMMTGTPYIMRLDGGWNAPGKPEMGVDYAGTVEQVGKKVTRFKPGDEVFGGRNGAFGEYVAAREQGAITHKPANVSFEQAAALPIAAITALQALRDQGRIRAGQKVLINGATGGVGTYAVQLAKNFGAVVTGVCSTRNVELVRSLGADEVIDYTQEDFTQRAARYDLIVDNVGNHGLFDLKHVLTPAGMVVIVGGPKEGPWVGMLSGPIKAVVLSKFIDQKIVFFIAKLNREDLDYLAGLVSEGRLQSVIDRRYRLAEVPAAMEYLAGRHARGKIIVSLDQ